jgi:hypothetical protein
MPNVCTLIAIIFPVCMGTVFKDPHDEWRTVLVEMLRADLVKGSNPNRYEEITRAIDNDHLFGCDNFRNELSDLYQDWYFGRLIISAADVTELDRFHRSINGLANLGMDTKGLEEIMESSYLYDNHAFRPLMKAILNKVVETHQNPLLVHIESDSVNGAILV